MNRPEALNALSKAVFADLAKALDQVEHDEDVYVVVITGSGRAFVAGADIGEMASMNVEEGLAFSELGNSLLMRVDMFPKPTIAAVNGFALGGGCELALACDIRVASEKAKFGQPEVGLGIIPGFGGTQRMARIVGTGQAMELIYTADTIDANRAKEIGMVNHVVAPDELVNFAVELANKIASKAQVAIRTSKLAIRRGIDCDISTAVTYEALAFATCFGTEDQKDAMKAFVEKRKLEGFKNR
jgi:enoyl-CoA hydratase